MHGLQGEIRPSPGSWKCWSRPENQSLLKKGAFPDPPGFGRQFSLRIYKPKGQPLEQHRSSRSEPYKGLPRFSMLPRIGPPGIGPAQAVLETSAKRLPNRRASSGLAPCGYHQLAFYYSVLVSFARHAWTEHLWAQMFRPCTPSLALGCLVRSTEGESDAAD